MSRAITINPVCNACGQWLFRCECPKPKETTMSKERQMDYLDYLLDRSETEVVDPDNTLGVFGPLFRYACPRGLRRFWEGHPDDPPTTGDVMLVHAGRDSLGRERVAHTPELTKAIRADKRIPPPNTKLNLSQLNVLAEWARKLAVMFGEPIEAAPAHWLKAKGLEPIP